MLFCVFANSGPQGNVCLPNADFQRGQTGSQQWVQSENERGALDPAK